MHMPHMSHMQMGAPSSSHMMQQMYMADYMVPQNMVGIPEMDIAPEKRITIWNKLERRKISGNAAPMGKNLYAYLSKHPECEVFTGQDKDDMGMAYPQPLHGPFLLGSTQETIMESMNASQHRVGDMPSQPHKAMFTDITEKRVTIWHTIEKRKISGNAAPMEKNLRSYLATHPECEVYVNQDKAEGGTGTGGTPSMNVTQATSVDGDEDEGMDLGDNTFMPGSLGFESQMEHRGIPIRSPAMYASHSVAMGISPMSPVESLPTSFNNMDFSFGSQHGENWRVRQNSYHHGLHAAHDFVHPSRRIKDDDDDDEMYRARSNTADDFGVMGKPDGF